MSTIKKRALRATFSFACLLGSYAAAQAQQVQPPQLPVSDVNCDYQANPRANVVPPCQVDGTRTVTVINQTVTPVSPSSSRVTGSYDVRFNGNLQVDGRPVTTGPGSPYTFDISVFGQSPAEIEASLSYLGRFNNSFMSNSEIANGNYAYFGRYENIALNLRRLNVAIDGGEAVDTVTGKEYRFDLTTPDPTAILNGTSVALTGRYQADPEEGPIVFGRLTGNAVLVVPPTGPVFTRSPEPFFANGGYISPLALQYQITAVETTRLDENGLVTPTISVTDGINMNGSAITNLAAGVNPGDAVNKAQLDTETAARTAADVALAAAVADEAQIRAASDVQLANAVRGEAQTRAAADTQLATAVNSETQARASADLQLSQRIDVESAARQGLVNAMSAETQARLAADIGLSSRLDAFGSRLDEIDSRLDRLDKHVAGATAVATAMSGNAFLPDMKFNLTANVATYDGAHAGSLQAGALVSRNVALNAGVASGFNKRGKAAARAGVTIGW